MAEILRWVGINLFYLKNSKFGVFDFLFSKFWQKSENKDFLFCKLVSVQKYLLEHIFKQETIKNRMISPFCVQFATKN
jgi:hypothetical protein